MTKIFFFILLGHLSTTIVYAQTETDQSHYQKSVDFFNREQIQSAFSEINLFLLAFPENVDGLNLRAFYYMQMDRLEQAIEDYSHVLRIDKTNMAALSNRALLYMELERYTLALKDLNIKADLQPDDWSVYFDRAYCLGLKGDHAQAIADFDKSLELNPNHAASYANRGFSKINLISSEGLIRPAPEQCEAACIDLKVALEMGDSSVTRMISLYCID